MVFLLAMSIFLTGVSFLSLLSPWYIIIHLHGMTFPILLFPFPIHNPKFSSYSLWFLHFFMWLTLSLILSASFISVSVDISEYTLYKPPSETNSISSAQVKLNKLACIWIVRWIPWKLTVNSTLPYVQQEWASFCKTILSKFWGINKDSTPLRLI